MNLKLSRSSRINLLFFFFVLILTIGTLIYSGNRARSTDAGRSEIVQGKVQKTYWTCSMHPYVHRDSPGTCPICGMTLVRVDEAEPEGGKIPSAKTTPSEHAPVNISGALQQKIGVKVGLVEIKPLFKDIRLAGRVAFDPELYTAQNEYAEALRQLERVKDSPLAEVKHSAEQMVRSAKLRLRILGLSDKQIARIGPDGGTDSSLLITKPGQEIWIYAEIYEMDLQHVRPDQSAEVTAGFLGGKALKGKVVSVDRVINPATRTAKGRILLSDKDVYLRPESYVDVTLHAPLGEQVTVPFDAVLETGKESWVFVLNQAGQFIPKLVTVRFYAGEEVAIETGLSGGERIVTSANFLIDSESRLKNADIPQKPEEEQKAKPSCSKNQHWDVPMAMCMPD